MRDNGAIIVRGEVLGIEHKSGLTKTQQPYSFHILSVLTGKAVSEVRWPEQAGPAPKEGEFIALEVGLDVFNGRQQIEAQKRVDPAASQLKPVAVNG